MMAYSPTPLQGALGPDQVRLTPLAGELENLFTQRDADGSVAELRLCGESLDGLPHPGLTTGAPEAADALGSEGEAHGAVDALQDPGQLVFARDEDYAADARRPPRDALRDADHLHPALPAPDPDAVIPGAELVAHLPDLRPDAQPPEGTQDQGCCLVVAVADLPPGLVISRRPDYGEAEGAGACSRSSSPCGADEHRVALLVGGPHGVRETWAERVASRHPDVAGRGCDRDCRRPLTSCHLLEDDPLVTVGRHRIFETTRRQ